MSGFLIVVACASSESDVDSEADGSGSGSGSGSGAGTGDTAEDSGTDTGTPPDRAGTYVGTMTVIAADVYGTKDEFALCSDPSFTIVVDAAGAVTGGGACTMPAPLEGKTFAAALVGALEVPPDLGGTVTITWPSVPETLPEEWAAEFEGPDTIDGHFEGTWTEGDQRFDYGAEFLLVR